MLILLLTSYIILHTVNGYFMPAAPRFNRQNQVLATYIKLKPFTTVRLTSPNYPSEYEPNTQVGWIIECPKDNLIVFNCSVHHVNCAHDTIEFKFTSKLPPMKYCGMQKRLEEIVSYTTRMIIGLSAGPNSIGGIFKCDLRTDRADYIRSEERCSCGCLRDLRVKDYEFAMLAGVIETNGQRVRCSAVIIDRHYVLAPSDCINNVDSLSDIKVFIAHGESSTITINSHTFDIEAFETIRENNSTARIKLTQPIEYDNHVMPACLLRSFDNYLYAGSTVTVVGYHYINFHSKLTSFKMDLLLVSRHSCEREYPNATNQLCTFSKYATQFNVPGSPIFYKDPGYNRVYIIGFSKHMYKASSGPEYHTKIELDPEGIIPEEQYHELRRTKREVGPIEPSCELAVLHAVDKLAVVDVKTVDIMFTPKKTYYVSRVSFKIE